MALSWRVGKLKDQASCPEHRIGVGFRRVARVRCIRGSVARHLRSGQIALDDFASDLLLEGQQPFGEVLGGDGAQTHVHLVVIEPQLCLGHYILGDLLKTLLSLGQRHHGQGPNRFDFELLALKGFDVLGQALLRGTGGREIGLQGQPSKTPKEGDGQEGQRQVEALALTWAEAVFGVPKCLPKRADMGRCLIGSGRGRCVFAWLHGAGLQLKTHSRARASVGLI